MHLFIDNKSAISLAKNSVSHGRSKYIETMFHFLRDQVSKGRLELVYCCTKLQVDDVFTKSVKLERFKLLRICFWCDLNRTFGLKGSFVK